MNNVHLNELNKILKIFIFVRLKIDEIDQSHITKD